MVEEERKEFMPSPVPPEKDDQNSDERKTSDLKGSRDTSKRLDANVLLKRVLLLFLPFKSSKADEDDDREGREGLSAAVVERDRKEEAWSIGGVEVMSMSEEEEGRVEGKAWELSMAREKRSRRATAVTGGRTGVSSRAG